MKKRPPYTWSKPGSHEFVLPASTAVILEAQLRKKAFAWHGKKCAKCGFVGTAQKQFVVHHRHYRNLGEELPEDVVILCHACHNELHARSRIKKLNKNDIPFVDPLWTDWLSKVEPD